MPPLPSLQHGDLTDINMHYTSIKTVFQTRPPTPHMQQAEVTCAAVLAQQCLYLLTLISTTVQTLRKFFNMHIQSHEIVLGKFLAFVSITCVLSCKMKTIPHLLNSFGFSSIKQLLFLPVNNPLYYQCFAITNPLYYQCFPITNPLYYQCFPIKLFNNSVL